MDRLKETMQGFLPQLGRREGEGAVGVQQNRRGLLPTTLAVSATLRQNPTHRTAFLGGC